MEGLVKNVPCRENTVTKGPVAGKSKNGQKIGVAEVRVRERLRYSEDGDGVGADRSGHYQSW